VLGVDETGELLQGWEYNYFRAGRENEEWTNFYA
jgi:hypothetical protein